MVNIIAALKSSSISSVAYSNLLIKYVVRGIQKQNCLSLCSHKPQMFTARISDNAATAEMFAGRISDKAELIYMFKKKIRQEFSVSWLYPASCLPCLGKKHGVFVVPKAIRVGFNLSSVAQGCRAEITSPTWVGCTRETGNSNWKQVLTGVLCC